jgi:aminomethyltransferase
VSNASVIRKTPLFDQHVALGGKMVEFAGWELPVQYRGVIEEHHAVRKNAGLFDVSHMGEVLVEGPSALKFLNSITCNDVRKIVDGGAQYNALTNERGGVIDDIIIYRRTGERFFICVNASNAQKDFEWIAAHAPKEVQVKNQSDQFGQIALQGPRSEDILATIIPEVKGMRPFSFIERKWKDVTLMVARTGYSGEDGFEIFVPWQMTPQLWNELLERGALHGIIPCGLGARDSLRLEAALPLHGHELGEEITTLESGLGWITKLEKEDFIGRQALLNQRTAGVPQALVGFFVNDSGIARHGDIIFDASGSEIGMVTSGTKTPTLNRALGLALVKSKHAALGSEIQIAVRGRKLAAQVVKKPFYKR